MRVGGDWLERPATQAVFAALSSCRVLAVGGCVRNAILGVPVGDVDLATDAPPDRVTRLAGEAGLHSVPTGLAHGTVTVVSDGIPHEVTTFRRDVETDGRHAVVAYTDRVEEDAARRDFTMNALYCTADGSVIDPLGGLPDVLARRVRFVGDAAARIAEDRLRILRFFRFNAWYGSDLDAEGLAACAAVKDGIESLSRERIGAEMRKLLAAGNPAPAVASMAAAGILAQVLPGAEAAVLAPLVHLEHDLPADPIRRLSALVAKTPTDALRLSRAEALRHAAVAQAARGGQAEEELGYRLGATAAVDAVLVRAALLSSPLPDGWQRAVAQGAAARFPVAAADLMPALQGPALGARLRALEDRWIASGFTLTRGELLADH